ncbi:MAG: response regulator [Verrucomicrobiota bacterium]
MEDEPAVLALIQTVLQRHGYRVFSASDADEAMDHWRLHAEQIDLVLADVTLPGGTSGVDLAHTLYAERPALKVLLTTGYRLPANGWTFIFKPFGPGALIREVSQLMHSSSNLLRL